MIGDFLSPLQVMLCLKKSEALLIIVALFFDATRRIMYYADGWNFEQQQNVGSDCF